MSKRWTHPEDMFLAKYFDIVGDQCGTHDLGKAKGAAARRVKHLKAVGAWPILSKILQDEFDNLSALMLATKDYASLESVCMTHVKAPYDWEDRFGFVTYDTPEARENHLNLLAKMAGVDRGSETPRTVQ